MLSAVAVCSQALNLLRCDPIESLDDESSNGAIVAKAHYDTERKLMLARYRWNFAHKAEVLSPVSGAPQVEKYKYAFKIPQDCLSVVVVEDDPEARIYGDFIYSNNVEITVEYIENPDETKTPVWFDEALKYRLAFVFAVPMTGKTELADYFFNQCEIAVKEALRIDAQQSPVPAFRVPSLGGSR